MVVPFARLAAIIKFSVAPTEIFESNKTLAKSGNIVPTSIVKLIDNKKMLFKEIAPSRDSSLISPVNENFL